MAKKPNIRFAGFEDDWEQRKVSELCSISTGKSNTQDKSEDGEYPFYVRSPIIERSTKYLYDEEAVITVGDGVGTGKVFHYVNGKYDLHQRCYRMYGFSDELNAHYFYHTFSKLFYKRVMAMTAKTSVDSVRLEMIADMEIPTPTIEEQIKIGTYFDHLDHLITLHQRKCDELKKVKKFMLQKMFPKKGEKNPEIRFDGFTNDWEQRKLGEVCSEIGDGLHSAPKYNDNGEVFFINGNNLVDGHIVIDPLKTRRVSKETFEKNNKHLDNNTLLLSINGTIGNLAYYQGEQVMLGKSIAYLKVNGIDHFFLYTSLQTAEILNSFMISLTGTTIKNLGLEAIKNTIIAVPKLEEQHKIGVYFSALDHLITLHQCKCKSCKKYYKCTRKLKCWYLIEEKFIFVIINIRVTDNKFYL